jgi:hypothetical protein
MKNIVFLVSGIIIHNVTEERHTLKSYKIITSCANLITFSCETDLYIGVTVVRKCTFTWVTFNRGC